MSIASTPGRIVFAIILMVLTAPAKAEQDIEYAELLMARQDFPTGDLVQRLIANLDRNSATKMDSKLIEAALKRRQAENASLEKRTVLLESAESIYHEILAGDKNYKYYSMAEKEAAIVDVCKTRTLLMAAHELDQNNQVRAKALRAEALNTLDKIATRHKGEADIAYAIFKQAYQKMNTDSKEGSRPPPREILDPLNRAFDKWIRADQHYVLSRIDQLECYDASDKVRKALVDELCGICEARVDDPILINFPIVTLRYEFMRCRAYAAVQDDVHADSSVRSIQNFDMSEMDEQQKHQVFSIQKQILYDLVKMKMRLKKYSDVEALVVDARTGNLSSIFDEDAGKEIMLDFAKALTVPADNAAEYQRAVNALSTMIERESRGVSTGWANDFARAIAEILEDARTKGLHPRLSAKQWYDAAHGFFAMGQNEHRIYIDALQDNPAQKATEQYEKSYTHFQSAVDYYHHAIIEARLEKTGLTVRLNIEPKCWFEMGLSYLKMQHFYEAMIANRALCDRYNPAKRIAWLPNTNKSGATPEQRRMAKQIQDILAELDNPASGLLYKCSGNLMHALSQNAIMHNNPNDHWNRNMKRNFSTETGAGDPEEESAYVDAKSDLESGRSFQKAAREDGDPGRAEENYGLALELFLKAAAKFSQIKPSTKAYEFALFQAGFAYTQAHEIWATGKLSGKTREQRLSQNMELSQKALEAFQKYDEFAAKTPAVKDEDIARREKMVGNLLLARSSLYLGTREWEKVIKASDAYIAWESSHSTAILEGQPESKRAANPVSK